MDAFLSGINIQNATTPIMAGGKLAGNIGSAGLSNDGIPFATMFQEAAANVENLDAIKSNDSYNLAIGDLDDVAEMMANSERAQVAFQLMVQMRNKVLDSYSELMRINV